MLVQCCVNTPIDHSVFQACACREVLRVLCEWGLSKPRSLGYSSVPKIARETVAFVNKIQIQL